MSVAKFSIAAAALSAAVVLGAASASADCKGWVEANADGGSQKLTESSAKSNWRGEARERYGSGYSRWNNARNARVNCRKAGDIWRCSAAGRACSS
jgi:opacity protein-like surface antigen